MDLRAALDRELAGSGHRALPTDVTDLTIDCRSYRNVAGAQVRGENGVFRVDWSYPTLEVAHLPALCRLRVNAAEGYAIRVGPLPSLVSLELRGGTLEIAGWLTSLEHADLRCHAVKGLSAIPNVRWLRIPGPDPDLALLSPRVLMVNADLPRVITREPAVVERLELGAQCRTLAGIRRFSGLRRLGIMGSRVTDLHALLELPALAILDVRDVDVDLSPLVLHPGLLAVAASGSGSVPDGLAEVATLSTNPDLPSVAARVSAQRAHRQVWAGAHELLLGRDLDGIAVACDALIAANSVALFDWLLDGVSVWNLHSAHLHPDPADRAFHLHALFRLIAQAPEDSVGGAIRADLDRVEVWFGRGLDAPVDLSVFVGFPKLRSLALHGVTAISACPSRLDIPWVELDLVPGAALPPGFESALPAAVLSWDAP